VVNHVRRSGVQLAALGADGRVLEDYGLQVGVGQGGEGRVVCGVFFMIHL
jgi:hypothetical protein